MKNNYALKTAILLLAAIILFASCASSTLIQSYPSGAKVFINGEQVGVTPYWYTDTKIMGTVTNVDLIKEGYQPLFTSIERNERVDFGAILGGFCLWVPFLWTMQYNPTHNFELFPLVSQSNLPKISETPKIDAPNSTTSIEKQANESVSPKLQKLRELKQMLDEKLISKEDFEKQKLKVLDEK